MDKDFDIQTYMTKGVERIVKDALKATLKNPKESAFMVKFAASSKSASNKRAELKQKGTHVPPFLIASITSQCNLHCEGCYSRCNNATVDEKPQEQLMKDDWDKVFGEASDLGVSFILLAGGEPMLRIDVIEAASTHKDIMFPIFTNGTYINGGLVGGLGLGVLILLSHFAIFAKIEEVGSLDMPMLGIVNNLSPLLGVVMSIVIFGMIYNTAVRMFFSFVVRFAEVGTKRYKPFLIGTMIVAYVASFAGFTHLVSYFYPLIGYLGLVLIAVLIITPFRMKKIEKESHLEMEDEQQRELG